MVGFFRSLYLRYFSQPKADRALYKLLKKQPMRKILELGIGTGERTLRVLEHCPASDETSYTGIDMFEARQNGDGAGLSLKAAHKMLSASGAKVRLVPGDLYMVLATIAWAFYSWLLVRTTEPAAVRHVVLHRELVPIRPLRRHPTSISTWSCTAAASARAVLHGVIAVLGGVVGHGISRMF